MGGMRGWIRKIHKIIFSTRKEKLIKTGIFQSTIEINIYGEIQWLRNNNKKKSIFLTAKNFMKIVWKMKTQNKKHGTKTVENHINLNKN